MSDCLTRLLHMHDLAAPHGGGLKPELAAMLRERLNGPAAGVTPLPVPVASAGPAHQPVSEAALDDAGIPILDRWRGRTACESKQDVAEEDMATSP
ncbi:MAG: hypothetical protein AAF565_09545 [Pseudomonadota bacterium]